MEETETRKSPSQGDDEVPSNGYKDLITTLPREKNWDGRYLYQYQGYWFPSRAIEGIISFQKNFQARDSDVVLSTVPKSGTTWLKALTFTIVNRSRFPLLQSPLLTSSPHGVVRFMEFDLYSKGQKPNLDHLVSPRIFATHAPYSSLPGSVKESNCRVVYLCRNPLDQFISHWLFLDDNRGEVAESDDGSHESLGATSLEDALEMFCNGVDGFGPLWDHVLGYWKGSLERPDKVMFLKYEDLKEDTVNGLKKLAKFLGFPFSEEEKKQGVIEEISRLCSFESLKDLQANKTGKVPWGVKNSAFFRNGKVGDWANYLTPSMAARIEALMQEKFSGSGLTFKLSHQLQNYV